MTTGAFMDKTHEPTAEEVLAALGPSGPRWQALVRYVSDTYQVEGELLFAGKKDGWAVRYKKGGKPLLWLYPMAGRFRALVVLGQAGTEKALASPLSDRTRKVIESAHQYHDGRWIFMPVESQQDVADVQQMLLAKARPPRRQTA